MRWIGTDGPIQIDEGSSGIATLEILLSISDLTVDLSLGGVTTDDATVATSVLIPAGSTTFDVTINALSDSEVEPPENGDVTYNISSRQPSRRCPGKSKCYLPLRLIMSMTPSCLLSALRLPRRCFMKASAKTSISNSIKY